MPRKTAEDTGRHKTIKLDDEQLEFAEQQSSHADVSRWGLVVEHNYSAFRGDVDGLLPFFGLSQLPVQAAADILADLSDAIGDSDARKMVRAHAARLAKQHSTLNVLKSSLRKRGLLE